MQFSRHPSYFDFDLARKQGDYAKRFTAGYEIASTVKTGLSLFEKNVWAPALLKDNYRLQENFIQAQLFGIDIDDPGYDLAQALNEWCDSFHIIGTTKNHQKLKRGLVCDRFRIIGAFEKPITDSAQYVLNIKSIQSKYGGVDTSCQEPARLFYPCAKVLSHCYDGYLYPVQEFQVRKRPQIQKIYEGGTLPLWVVHFLSKGELPAFNKFADSRNWTIWLVALAMLNSGYSPSDIESRVNAAPFNREGIKDSDVKSRIKSAVKKYAKECEV